MNEEEARGMALSAALGMEDTAEDVMVGVAILDHLRKSEGSFPKRFHHHSAIKDSSIALANFGPEEKRQMEANLYILQVLEQATLYRFEIENDFSFFQDLMNEQIYFKKNLSLGTGKLLETLRTSMKIVDVGKKQPPDTNKRGFLLWRR